MGMFVVIPPIGLWVETERITFILFTDLKRGGRTGFVQFVYTLFSRYLTYSPDGQNLGDRYSRAGDLGVGLSFSVLTSSQRKHTLGEVLLD